MLNELRKVVCQANKDLATYGLAPLTWGNVSGFDAASKLMVIKPSGVAYPDLTPANMVIVNLAGKVVEGRLRPSSDTPTHVHLYKHFKGVGGIVHMHSRCATAFSQARREIPCMGTTHADHFMGAVPVTRPLRPAEVNKAYEEFTGHVIVERFKKIDPLHMPAVLVAGHGPFAWGKNAMSAVHNAVALEAVAAMAMDTMTIAGKNVPLEKYVLAKHFDRKHGKNAYYGQGKSAK